MLGGADNPNGELPSYITGANMYESQLYNWRSKQQNQQTSSERELEMSTEIARLKRQLAERDEELAILQKAATYFAKRLK